MTLAVDSNVLVYAIDVQDAERRAIAVEILRRAEHLDFLLPAQCIGEFLNVARRRRARLLPETIELATFWSALFEIAETTPAHLIRAYGIAERYKLQFWDSVILEVSRANGANVILTEGMQDGAVIEGVRLINPFLPHNRAALDALLAQ